MFSRLVTTASAARQGLFRGLLTPPTGKLYDTHIPTGAAEKASIAVKSSLGALRDPERAGLTLLIPSPSSGLESMQTPHFPPQYLLVWLCRSRGGAWRDHWRGLPGSGVPEDVLGSRWPEDPEGKACHYLGDGQSG